MVSVISVNFLGIMQENVLHKDHFTLILSDLHMVEGEEAEVLTIFFQEHLSLQEEGEEEEEEHDFSNLLK
jgi:hypothetical protein